MILKVVVSNFNSKRNVGYTGDNANIRFSARTTLNKNVLIVDSCFDRKYVQVDSKKS